MIFTFPLLRPKLNYLLPRLLLLKAAGGHFLSADISRVSMAKPIACHESACAALCGLPQQNAENNTSQIQRQPCQNCVAGVRPPMFSATSKTNRWTEEFILQQDKGRGSVFPLLLLPSQLQWNPSGDMDSFVTRLLR